MWVCFLKVWKSVLSCSPFKRGCAIVRFKISFHFYIPISHIYNTARELWVVLAGAISYNDWNFVKIIFMFFFFKVNSFTLYFIFR